MSEAPADAAPALETETVTIAALALGEEADTSRRSTRFLQIVERWASPRLVLCLERDPEAEGGLRVVPELSTGAAPPGFDRLLEAGEASASQPLERPVVVKAGDEIAGVRVRDNWLVPWRRGGAAGLFLLRGVARPYPPNLGDAVALLAAALGDLLGGGDAGAAPAGGAIGSLEALRGELTRIGERIEQEMRALRQEPGTGAAAAAATAAATAELTAELAGLRARVAALEQSVAIERARADEAETARDGARHEAEERRRRVAALEAEGRELRGRLTSVETQQAGALVLQRQLQEFESELRAARAASDAARKEAEAQRARVQEIEAARDDAESKRAKLQVETAALRQRLVAVQAESNTQQLKVSEEIQQLFRTLESQRRQIKEQQEGFGRERAALEAARLAAVQAAERVAIERSSFERERDEVRGRLRTADERAREAEGRVRELADRWVKSEGAFREALVALRRTPFVPPTLRVAVAQAEQVLEPDGRKAPATDSRVLFLDRDPAALERMAATLEAAGVGVLIANQPEEVGFFARSSEAQGLRALVCDVQAFRSDQEMMELSRAWKQALPRTAVYLTFRGDVAWERERAQRMPPSLGAGYLPRPLQPHAVLEALGHTGQPAR